MKIASAVDVISHLDIFFWTELAEQFSQYDRTPHSHLLYRLSGDNT